MRSLELQYSDPPLGWKNPRKRERRSGPDATFIDRNNMLGKKVSDSEVVMLHPLEENEANAWGAIHGGHLLRHIDNAGGIVAMRHARALVVTASIDSMDFLCPLRPGECIILKGSMHLVGRTSMEVGVRVEVENPLTGTVRHAATCYLTYVAMDARGRPIEVPPLILTSDLERRRFEEAAQRKDKRLKRLAEKKAEEEQNLPESNPAAPSA